MFLGRSIRRILDEYFDWKGMSDHVGAVILVMLIRLHLPMSVLRRYTGTRGIEIGAEGIDVERTNQPVLKQIDLRHRSRWTQ